MDSERTLKLLNIPAFLIITGLIILTITINGWIPGVFNIEDYLFQKESGDILALLFSLNGAITLIIISLMYAFCEIIYN